MIFREPFATWVLAFASSNHSKVAFASFRGEYRENKCLTIHHHVSVKESLAHSILNHMIFRHELSSTFGDLYSIFREFSRRILWKQMSFVLAHLHEPVPAPKHSYRYFIYSTQKGKIYLLDVSSWGKGLWLGTSAFARLSRSFRATFADFHGYFWGPDFEGTRILFWQFHFFICTNLSGPTTLLYDNINLIQSHPSSILAVYFAHISHIVQMNQTFVIYMFRLSRSFRKRSVLQTLSRIFRGQHFSFRGATWH